MGSSQLDTNRQLMSEFLPLFGVEKDAYMPFRSMEQDNELCFSLLRNNPSSKLYRITACKCIPNSLLFIIVDRTMIDNKRITIFPCFENAGKVVSCDNFPDLGDMIAFEMKYDNQSRPYLDNIFYGNGVPCYSIQDVFRKIGCDTDTQLAK